MPSPYGELNVIVNPHAGRRRVGEEVPELERTLRARGLPYRLQRTEGPGDATRFATEALEAGGRFIVAVGGDGTVHEVVNGLLRAEGHADFGVLPLGSGDDFAKMLPPRDPVERIARGAPRPFDAGRIASGSDIRFFANGMDVGFGAHGAYNVRRVPRLLTGFGAYLGALALTLIDYPRLDVRIGLDGGEPVAQSTTIAAVMNGCSFGGSFGVCPQARADDGWLDLMVSKGCSRLDILSLVPKILRGTHAGDPRLRFARAKHVLIESDAPLLVEADGEIAFEDARRLEIEVLPGALRVLV